MTVLVRVVAPHFVAGVVIDRASRRCVEAAPILRYCEGRAADELARYFKNRGWIAERC